MADPLNPMEKIPPDALAQSFLQRANQDGVGALVVYAFKTPEGRSVVHMASNRDDKATQGILGWVNKVDDRLAEVSARAICAADNGNWEKLSDAEKHNYTRIARIAVEAARAEGPKTMNVIKAS